MSEISLLYITEHRLTCSRSARGNTTLESAATLTKALQWDIQSLGARIQKAAIAEEHSKQKNNQAKSRIAHEHEIRKITQDIRNLLTRIDDAVPLINLAITTSGATLSTQLPSSVSPSRLLQASTYLSAGDKVFLEDPYPAIQVGPTFTLSLYMLFAGHANRLHIDIDDMRETTWKEVIHKARVKLVRFPKETPNLPMEKRNSNNLLAGSMENSQQPSLMEHASHYSYRFDIIEDLDDDRVHSFEDDELQPGRYHDVALAGIREHLPIYQISKIFYADTGKILNIGNADEPNSPILLLKRDVNARPSTAIITEDEMAGIWSQEPSNIIARDEEEDDENESQDDIDRQIHRESSINLAANIIDDTVAAVPEPWKFPADLDPEWLAFEVYTESEGSASEDGDGDGEASNDSAYVSYRPSSSGEYPTDKSVVAGIANLTLNPTSSPTQIAASNESIHSTPRPSIPPNFSPSEDVRFTSLSTLEMLIRLASVQQFKQQSHLVIPDELLSFFLQDSSTTGAGRDEKQRRRMRLDAVTKVGFDPYNESPIRLRGEKYQTQNYSEGNNQEYSREGTPYEQYEQQYSREGTPYDEQYQYSRGGIPYEEYDPPVGGYNILSPRSPQGPSPRWSEERDMLQATPSPWLLRDKAHTNSSASASPHRAPPSSPISPYRPAPKQGISKPLDRVMRERVVKAGSPLGRGMSVETDSSLGTSPASARSPTLVDPQEKTACDE
jgi:hypothetical protein